MSYVIANTGNPLGRRNLSRLGWDNIPYPRNPLSRSVAVLNGEFNPAGADPSTNANGAITYRIDPRTGRYIFSRTDIKPRGPFMQNTFQHPAPPVMTPLGVRALPVGASVTASTMVRGRTSRGPMIAMRPGIQLSGLGCNCGGSCNTPLSGPRFNLRRRRRFMGADECSIDSDCGPNAVCGAGQCISVDQPFVPTGKAFQPGGIFSDPSTFATGPSPVSTIAQGIQQVVQTITGPRVVTTQQPVSWWDQKTSIGGAVVSNPVLAAGAVGFAFLLAGMGGKRR